MKLAIPFIASLLSALCAAHTSSALADDLSAGLVFLAPFDDSFDAVIGADRQLCTADSLKRESIVAGNQREDVQLVPAAGRHGAALRFGDGGATKVTMFRGINAAYRPQNWSGTVSLWLRLTPDEDLKPGYCDPLQITDKTWNDAAFFIDFDKDLPRTFRLGVFPDYRSWNPADTPWEQIAVADRPMVPVNKPPFSRSSWTHVAWTFAGLNSGSPEAVAELYLNGRSQGRLKRAMNFSWQPEKTAIMLGIAYTGDLDELAIYNRALTPAEIETLYRLPKGLTSIAPAPK